MAERKFKPGDKVRLIKMPIDGKFLTLKVGDVGTVVRTEGLWVSVNWGRNVHGHTCGMIDVPYGHGWNVRPDCLEPAKVSEVHIKSDGKKTEACIKKGERGSCICSKSDEFDFPTGAAIALARAYGIDPADLAQRICKAVGHDVAKAVGGGTKAQEVVRKALRLTMFGEDCGVVGRPTTLIDGKGAKLYVGDAVLVRSKEFGYVLGESFVVHNDGQDYVMGMLNDCEDGKLLNKEFEVEWSRSWKEFKAGDVVGPVTVV